MLTDTHIESMAGLFAKNLTSIRNLNGYHNYIYEVCGNRTFILRISKDDNLDATNCEIDFLRYLYKNGCPVAPPVLSLQKKYVHLVNIDEKSYAVSAYKKAVGKDWRTRGIDGRERLIIIGRILGKMHKLSMQYKPCNRKRRRQWDESPHIVKAPGIFVRYNENLLEKFNYYMSRMRKFPKNKDSFGLVHGDFLFSNYFFDENNRISVFDFDECEYSWYIYDIAVCMYYYLLGGRPKELDSKAKEAEEMFYHILLGYISECELDMDCLRNMNLFFQLREYVLLSSVLEASMNNLNGWNKDFVEGAIDRILTGKPFINVDFEEIYNKVARDKL
ncbi:MAG TPA: phosphotransferase [Clostridiaceae bacterium]|nr:phosphotransferase [Clostridiaceae bacterium]